MKNKATTSDLLHQFWSASHAASYAFVRRFSIIHHYPLPPVSCKLQIPSAELAGLAEDYEVDSVPRDEFRQSLTLDGESGCPETSGPA